MGESCKRAKQAGAFYRGETGHKGQKVLVGLFFFSNEYCSQQTPVKKPFFVRFQISYGCFELGGILVRARFFFKSTRLTSILPLFLYFFYQSKANVLNFFYHRVLVIPIVLENRFF